MALLGRKVGETVSVDTQVGVVKYKVIEIHNRN
jgi:transcription elongation GreA/GreB family factor